MIYKNGTIREYEWIKDAPLIDSEFKYPNGDIYTGVHANGKRYGHGIMKYF